MSRHDCRGSIFFAQPCKGGRKGARVSDMPDEATTSLRAHLPGPCLRNDQPLTVYVAASPLLSLSLPFASLLSASQPPLSRAGCLALLVSLCLSGSACLALPVWLCSSRSVCLALPLRSIFLALCPALSVSLCLSLYLSRTGCLALPVLHCPPRSICPALPVWLWLSRSICPALPVWICLSRSICMAVPVSLCLSGCACLALPVWLCLFRCACLALSVWLCPSGSACLALQRTDTAHSPCLLQDHSRWKTTCTQRYAPLSLFAHSNTLSAHILSVVSQAALPPRCI